MWCRQSALERKAKGTAQPLWQMAKCSFCIGQKDVKWFRHLKGYWADRQMGAEGCMDGEYSQFWEGRPLAESCKKVKVAEVCAAVTLPGGGEAWA